MMRGKRILAVVTELFGNRALSHVLVNKIKELVDYDVRCLFIKGEDYGTYLKKCTFSNALDMAIVARKKFKERIEFDYDYLLINGYEIGYGLYEEVRSHPVILGLDSVPSAVHESLNRVRVNPAAKLKSMAALPVTRWLFGRVFKDIRAFMPMSEWCGQALRRDYGIPEEKIFVTHCPVDLNVWTPLRDKKSGDKIKLLFVGNDFYRKGGDMLVRIFEQRFISQPVALTIVSNDPSLSREDMPKGVTLLNDVPHGEIAGVFQDSDIFLFPTKKEYLGVAAIEAAAVGLPIIARDVGGLREFIFDGDNGFLMPYKSGEEEWVEKIQYLIDRPEERKRMGRRSRWIAEKMFGMERFETLVRNVLSKLEA
ncbi:MAG: glycosyltransferase [Candidatus Omnitrophota bacterium]